MQFAKPLLLSGLFAAVVVGGLVLLTMNRQPALPPAAPAPTVQPAPAPAPPGAVPPAAATKTFTDAKLGFSADFPDSVIPTEDKPDMALSGYMPVCDPDTAIVCFPYGKDQLPGRNFDGAAFSVHVLPTVTTAAKCEAAGNGEQADGTASIGGVSFMKFKAGDAAMGHQLSGEKFRAFKDGTCFQLSTDIYTSTIENYPSGLLKPFTDDERASVQKILDAMLDSFRFN